MPMQISTADARRAFVNYHFGESLSLESAFSKLRSVQFDPLSPAGCNHDLVLQARISHYRVGDWESLAYEKRAIYDGWDKMASLVPFEGWPLRRIFYDWYAQKYGRVLREYPDAVTAILGDIEARGPLRPKDCEFQAHRADWAGSWHGASVSKQVLRALWHTGLVMISGRQKGQHLYDLPERVVPVRFLRSEKLSESAAVCELVLERHRAMGIVRPSAAPEIWSYSINAPMRAAAFAELIGRGELVAVEIDGMKVHATPAFLAQLDQPRAVDPSVRFLAPLDPFMWDRKMIAGLFGFDYVWEVYVPEAKRRWGYYVLPVLSGERLIGRAELWCRAGTLEIRRWYFEPDLDSVAIQDEIARGLARFSQYCGATQITCDPAVDESIASLARSAL